MTPAAATTSASRNPGPSWGYQFLLLSDRVLPEIVFRPVRAIGTAIALVFMREQRRHSRAYLSLVLDRPPKWSDHFRHFFAFEESLMLKLRIINGRSIPCDFSPSGQPFREWLNTGGPMLLGTMHVGASDMLGFQLAECRIPRIHIVRQRVDNSPETKKLAALYGQKLHFIWVNEPDEMLFALKEAAAAGDVIALQCDRTEFSTRLEAFDFLGVRVLFPVTIYHLAHIFQRPVLLTIGLPTGSACSRLYGSPRFDPIPGETRDVSLARAHKHFQEFLNLVDKVLREQPYLWFNFTPLRLAP